MKPFIKIQNSFDQDNITRAVCQGFSINEKHSEISWLVWFGLVWLNVAGTTVTSRVTHVSNGYLAQSKEGRFTEVTSSNMQLNRIILTEPLLIFKFTESLVFKYYLT